MENTMPTQTRAASLLEVNNLKKHFPIKRGWASRTVGAIKAVDGVSFSVREGETFGLVGESGCGKTTTGRLVLRAFAPTEGEIWFHDREQGRINLPEIDGSRLKKVRRNMQMIFQDPYSSLNPRMTLLEIVGEPLTVHGVAKGSALTDRVAELLRVVGLRPEYMTRYPHAFSGGQRQRIGIARALALNPQLIVCDEPVSALDVAIQAQMLNLMMRLQRDFGLTYLFISHDLGVVRHLCNEVAVMYLGRIVEQAGRDALFARPLHPYTRALWSAAPSFDPGARSRAQRIRLQGDPPSPLNIPPGCRFAGRCPFAQDACRASEPELRTIADGHRVACHRVSDDGRALYAGE
jgi:peptide/nickel transport system ATP-binding protein